MLQKQSVAGLYKGDVMCKCDSVRIPEPWCHIEGDMWCIQLMWTKYDVTDGADVKCMAPYWTILMEIAIVRVVVDVIVV